MYSPDKMRVNHVIGTPDQAIERLKKYESRGFDEFAYWVDNNMPFEKKKQALELFIEKVMPEFQ